MQTLVEIGPSNTSQGQHRRKDAKDQMKNLTLARTRTQVLGFSGADAFPTSLRVSVCRTWIPISFLILNSLRCLHFMWTFILDMLLLSVFLLSSYLSTVDFIIYYSSSHFAYVDLESTLLNYAKPCRNWSVQHITRAAQKKGRNGTNEKSVTRYESNPGPRLL